jgi:hypothetical protein
MFYRVQNAALEWLPQKHLLQSAQAHHRECSWTTNHTSWLKLIVGRQRRQ